MAKRNARRGWGEGRIEQLPSGQWRAVLSTGKDADGKRVRVSKSFGTKPEAVAWLAEQQAARGLNRGSGPGNWTLGDWCKHWLDTKRTEREHGTWRYYEQRVRLYVVPLIGDVKLVNLSRIVVDSWRAKLATLSPSQQHIAAKTLRALCNDAVEAGMLPSNPVKSIRKPKGVRSRKINPFTKDEARAFLAATESARVLIAYWWLALDSGARPGELLALTWPDIDLERGSVRISKSVEWRDGAFHVKAPKTEAGNRVIPIAPATVTKLVSQRERLVSLHRYDPQGLVFPVKQLGQYRHLAATRQQFNRIREAAGLSPRRLYDLRHTSATLLLSAGVSLRVVADRLGHDDPGITLRFYAGALPSEQEAARLATTQIYGSIPG